MAQLRIGLAQVNATVGDLAGNSDKVIEWTRRAADRGARLVVFTEMSLTGYPVEDLVLRTSFVEASISAVGRPRDGWRRRGSASSRWSSATWTARGSPRASASPREPR